MKQGKEFYLLDDFGEHYSMWMRFSDGQKNRGLKVVLISVVLVSHETRQAIWVRKVTLDDRHKMRKLVGAMVDELAYVDYDFQEIRSVMEVFSAKRLVKQSLVAEKYMDCIKKGRL